MAHLLVTNDFPPKLGGIQSYLWELWRRLPAERVSVLTTRHRGDEDFDAGQTMRITRRQRVLLPTPSVVRQVRKAAAAQRAGVVVLDPALPLGLIGPSLGFRYGVVVHGGEITAPARLPGTRQLLQRVLRGASIVIAAGRYPAAEARLLAGDDVPIVEVPPGVDIARFRPLSPADRRHQRAAAGLPAEGRVVLGLSRLVPRKGMDILVRAAARLGPARPDLVVVIAGPGRDRGRLERLARRTRAPVRFLGPVPDERLPGLFGCADVFTMLCRSRWGGLEQEGFGVVFLEAAACRVPQVAGASGGAAEAVVHGETGFVVDRPKDVAEASGALARLLDDRELRLKQAEAARRRVEEHFSYDRLAAVLDEALQPLE